MAHLQQINFCLSVREKFPEYFIGKWILDIGALDINGNNQYLFDESGYIGIDLLPGKNVDFCSKGHELQFPDSSFDVIVSTECFEHDPYYELTIKNILRMLKPGGLFLFSCATTGRPEHGTRRTTPEDAPLTHEFGEWGDYYKNLDEDDIRKILPVDQVFSAYEFSVQETTHDLYFWGIKQGSLVSRNNYSFQIDNSFTSRLIKKLEALEQEKNISESRCIEQQEKLKLENSNLKLVEFKLKEKECELERRTEILNAIIGSRSWRFTRPLRYIFKKLGIK